MTKPIIRITRTRRDGGTTARFYEADGWRAAGKYIIIWLRQVRADGVFPNYHFSVLSIDTETGRVSTSGRRNGRVEVIAPSWEAWKAEA